MGHIFQRVYWLLFFSVIICCVIYPLVVWAIGQTVFPFQANGSILQRARRQAGRLAADRATLYQGRILPAAAVGGVLRRFGVRVLDPGRFQLYVAQPRRPRAGTDRQIQERTQGGPTGGTRHRGLVPAGQVRGQAAHRRAVGRPAQRRRPSMGQCRSDARRVRRRVGQELSRRGQQLGQGQSGHPAAQGCRPGGGVLREFLQGQSGKVSRRR